MTSSAAASARSRSSRGSTRSLATAACRSCARAGRQTAELEEIPTDGLHEQVERRAELRELLGDLRELPEEQRAALLLAEAADLSHAEVAGVLGCEVARVKALVFRARSGLIERREARETPCADIREQLANLRGGSLRRSELRHHLRHCPGCSDYREQVRRQRQMFAAALPVVPSMGLKSSVLSAAGIGGGAARRRRRGRGSGGAAARQRVRAAWRSAGRSGQPRSRRSRSWRCWRAAVSLRARLRSSAGLDLIAAAPRRQRLTGVDPRDARPAKPGGNTPRIAGASMSAERSHGRRGAERSAARSNGHSKAGTRLKAARDKPPGAGGRKLGQFKRTERSRTPASAHAVSPRRSRVVRQSRRPSTRCERRSRPLSRGPRRSRRLSQ